MNSRKKKIAGLLKRYRFVDFAEAIATPPHLRKFKLKNYIDREDRGRWRTYSGFMALIPDIMGVPRGLDDTRLTFDDVTEGLKARCHKDDLEFNTEAASCLWHFASDKYEAAYGDHHKRDLRIAPDRTIEMGVKHYVVDQSRGAFQFVYPRKSRLDGGLIDVMLSLIHHNYVDGDFDEFDVEIIDLSCEPVIGARGGVSTGSIRDPRVITLDGGRLLPRDELNHQANDIYRILMEIGNEPPA